MNTSNPSQLEPAAQIARHAHAGAYATLVLSGGYEEAGDAGRFNVAPGDVLIHAAFSAHRDAVRPSRTLVLDLALPDAAFGLPAHARLRDADVVIRTARRDAKEAAGLLVDMLTPASEGERELPDLLACEMTRDPSLAIASLARGHGVSRETAWRHFRATYGVDIATFRSEARTRRAWREIMRGGAPLADVAADAGFSDQAHMSRAVKALTGHTPGYWRRESWRQSATSVQDRAHASA